MSTRDFERDDALEGLSSEELEEQAFGPDPNRKRRRGRRSRRGAAAKASKASLAVPARIVPAPAAPVPPPALYCYACGDEVDGRAEVCPRCGVAQPEVVLAWGREAERTPKSKGAATLLALGLGGVGGHRFYLGQWKVGLAMLLVCWTLLPALFGVVDFVRLAFMSDARFAELYNAPRVPRVGRLRQARPLGIRRRRIGRGRPDDEDARDD